jgi:8-oxo-dGTP pyrophosphatase MutT (NUDIX family)
VTALVPASALPAWLHPVAEAANQMDPLQLSRFLPPADGSARQSAVLVLFGDGQDGHDVLLIERSHGMRSHPAQVAFPGGAVDPEDADVVATALRETAEETGADPAGIDVFGVLPDLWLPPSNFAVTPVLGWWREPSEVLVVDPDEVESVLRAPIQELLDPVNRFTVKHPSGFLGPAFGIRGLVLWGFTAGVLSRLFTHLGWELPWDAGRIEPLPDHLVELAWRTYDVPTDAHRPTPDRGVER